MKILILLFEKYGAIVGITLAAGFAAGDGDFELLGCCENPDAEGIRQQGSVIFFPSMFMHKANPVIRGTRYSIAAWIEGPKWR